VVDLLVRVTHLSHHRPGTRVRKSPQEAAADPWFVRLVDAVGQRFGMEVHPRSPSESGMPAFVVQRLDLDAAPERPTSPYRSRRPYKVNVKRCRVQVIADLLCGVVLALGARVISAVLAPLRQEMIEAADRRKRAGPRCASPHDPVLCHRAMSSG
jgi:hypothetical protein